jgi:hypothetical protein
VRSRAEPPPPLPRPRPTPRPRAPHIPKYPLPFCTQTRDARQAAALEFYGDLFSAGRLPSPARLTAPIVRAFALAGDIATAQTILDEGARDGARLDAPCFNGLLEGLVKYMAGGDGGGAAAGGVEVRGDVIYGIPLEEQ